MANCYICGSLAINVESSEGGCHNRYECFLCGYVAIAPDQLPRIDWHTGKYGDSQEELKKLSIVLRNEYEESSRTPPSRNYTIEELRNKINQYTPLDAVDKMDVALLKLNRMEESVGSRIYLTLERDYPLFHCTSNVEMADVIRLLAGEGYLKSNDPDNPQFEPRITGRGYQRLREIKQRRAQSNQCFVAMWFTEEMDEVYQGAIRPAIEYQENGLEESRFRALRLDNEEHINNINDEIIAQIRRSKFMVCDLTGYRGGVYFEAGFAYGLGLDVIYTCRKDWSEDQILKDKPGGDDVSVLYDDRGQEVYVRKEGIHFDLAHMNRIEWDPDDLDDFRTKLENRIKAVIL